MAATKVSAGKYLAPGQPRSLGWTRGTAGTAVQALGSHFTKPLDQRDIVKPPPPKDPMRLTRGEMLAEVAIRSDVL
jgi:hypothetical protein